MIELAPFQRRFLAAFDKPGVRAGALSIARGNGKSTFAAWLLKETLEPGGRYHAGRDVLLLSASMRQARVVFKALRKMIEPTGRYTFQDSNIRLGAKGPHGELEVLSSSGRGAMGFGGGESLIVFDEPAATKPHEGKVLWDAVLGAVGKPGGDLRLLMIGTRAPAPEGHFWPKFLDNPPPWATVTDIAAHPARWSEEREVLRVNPLMRRFPESRRTLLDELADAKRDPAAAARFKSYRLNLASEYERVVLVEARRWMEVCSRPVAERAGQPVVGIDLGGTTSWSAAVAVWPSTMRCEALAVTPGKIALDDQEAMDHVPAGVYSALARDGGLVIQEGRETCDVGAFCAEVGRRFGNPAIVLADRYRSGELRDAMPGWNVEWRLANHVAQSSEDCGALRNECTGDGTLSTPTESGKLIAASLAQSLIELRTGGLMRLIARRRNNKNDVAAALVLAVGEAVKRRRKPKPMIVGVKGAW